MKKSRLLIIEMFSIVFAVLLALTLDTWQETLKEQRKIEHSLSTIHTEILNMSGISFANDMNKTAMEELNNDISTYDKNTKEPIRIQFVRPENSNLAWVAAKENGTSNEFDREVFLDLAAIYEERSRLVNMLNYYSEFELKFDPNMDPLTYAIHKKRQLHQIIFRSDEVDRKANKFLKKYQRENFAQKD
jgi:hypothetical protein